MLNLGRQTLALLLGTLCLASCGEDEPRIFGQDEPLIYGDVDPAFTQAMADYRAWDGSCAPRDAAREAGIAAGVLLLRVDAMECAYRRLAAADPEDLAGRKEKAKLAATLYGMTGDKAWRSREFCDVPRGERSLWRYELGDAMLFVSTQPTSDKPDFPAEFSDRASDYLYCEGDWDIPNLDARDDH